ncbi:hypothetical protein DPMN_022637 [Dreissena polymorpha]|uniref:Uncharacterized protein n=1 Tax=Dreissena polymorpha TaxID=45954 RepID=A0A9D4NQQ8_DREPO|nr:hypothetical protein DPMN_022637 [Dreissena polymorpha]
MVMYGAVEAEVVEMDNHMEPHFGHEHRLCNVAMQIVPVEKLCSMIPRSIHASLLRNNLSDESVTYVICWVVTGSPVESVLEMRSKIAPRILIPSLLAVCIRIVTGSRSDSLKPRRWITLRPTKQL